MAANVEAFTSWSTTLTNNQPTSTDSADLVSDLTKIQSEVRKYVATKGADIASATTTNLATATGNYVHITGVTQIDGFGTVSVGVRFILVFDDILLLNYNATSLILPTAADITTAAGDRCELVSLGSGNWRCLWYQRADGTPLAYDAELTAIAGLTSAANVVPRFTGSGTAEVFTLTSGTYTPTVTNKTNVASVGTVTDAHYFRIGNEVTVRGRFIATPTATGATEVYVTLPVPSNLAAATDLVGTGYVDDYLTAAVIGDASDKAIIVANVASTSALNFLYDFTYTVV